MHNTPDLSTLSAEDLKAEIARRELEAQKKAKAERLAYDKDNEDFIEQTVSKFHQLHRELKSLKDFTIREANKLYNRMYALEGKDPKVVKTFSRVSKDGNFKITVEMQERFTFANEAEVHLAAIQDIFKNKFESRNKGLYSILNGLLLKGNKGDYDPKLLAKARKQVRDLGDNDLIAEFDKLDECQRVVGSSLYCRAYTKNSKNQWEDISLNFSSL